MTGAAGVLQLVLEQGARGSQSPSRGEASVGRAVAELQVHSWVDLSETHWTIGDHRL